MLPYNKYKKINELSKLLASIIALQYSVDTKIPNVDSWTHMKRKSKRRNDDGELLHESHLGLLLLSPILVEPYEILALFP